MHGFPRRLRLRTEPEFRAVYAEGRRAVFGPFAVHARANDLPYCRLGLSVPRRAGTAVRRNRIKRLLRESFRLARQELPTGYDLVVNVRPHRPLGLDDCRRAFVTAAATAVKRCQEQAGSQG